MEDLRRYAAQESVPEAKEAKKPRWLKLVGEDFFKTWQERLDDERRDADQETDEEDEVLDKTEKPSRFGKRWRKLWHGLFPRVVQAETGPDRAEAASMMRLEADQTEPDTKPDAAENWPNQSVAAASSELPPEASAGSGDEAPPPLPPTGGEGPPVLPPEKGPLNQSQAAAEAAFAKIARQEAEAAREAAKRQAVGTSFVLDLLDPIGRLRENRKDRKTLAKADKLTEQKLTPIKEANQKIEQQLGEQQSKIINLQAETARETAQLAENQRLNEAKSAKLPPAEKPVYLPPEKTVSLNMAVETNRPAEPKEAKRPSPEVVFKQVQKAAEQDAPLEALFERRHEIKDQPAAEPAAARLKNLDLPPNLAAGWSSVRAPSQIKTAQRAPGPQTSTAADETTAKQVKNGALVVAVVLVILAALFLIF